MRKIFKNKKFFRAVLSVLVIVSMFVIPGLIVKGLNSIGIENEIIVTITYMVIYMALIVLIYLKELKEEFIIFKTNFKQNLNTGFKYWSLGLLLMIVSNMVITLIIFKGQIPANEALNRQQMLSQPLLTLFSAVIFAPIAEEIIFRKSIDKIFGRMLTYVLVSGILFGFVHTLADLSSPLNLLYIIPYGSLGACFAIMNYKTKTIFTSMSMHFLHNFLICIILLLAL